MWRAKSVLLVVAGLLLSLGVTSVASARHKPPHGKGGTAAFAPGFSPPKSFVCEWVDSLGGKKHNVHAYACIDPTGEQLFLLKGKSVLTRNGNKPFPNDPFNSWAHLAHPDVFSCLKGTGSADPTDGAALAHIYECSYSGKDGKHTFRVDEIVSTSANPNSAEEADTWYPLATKATK
jgi:hypothetical protein